MEPNYRHHNSQSLRRPSAVAGPLIFLLCLFALPQAPVAGATSYHEAPEFQALVAQGKLPPVDQRLPRNPMVIFPTKELGEYGGEWKIGLLGYDHGSLLTRSIGYENLVRWDPLWTRVVPNLAQSWETDTESRVFTFQLRKGVRWSDGAPFTARDVEAWVTDVVLEPELTTSPPAWLMSGGRLAEIKVLDEFQIQFRFAQPNALFLYHLASAGASELTRYPRHYLRTFHLRHSQAMVRALMTASGQSNWASFFRGYFAPWLWTNPDLPTLDAWSLVDGYRPGRTTVRASRNPYYWKIDTRGRQLPYLDRVVGKVASSRRELLRMAISGEINFQRDLLDGPSDRPALEAGQLTGGYRLIKTVPAMASPLVICLNLVHRDPVHRDPVKRELYQDRRFRVALSESIHRRRIISEVYGNAAKPWQLAPRSESPLRYDPLGSQFTNHDPGLADQVLDTLGLEKRAADGVRLMKNGERLEVEILMHTNHGSEWPEVLQVIRENWRAVGVGLRVGILPRQEFYARLNKNQHDAAVWWGDGGITPLIQPEFYVPVTFEQIGPGRVPYGAPWAAWFVNPQDPIAERPPESVRLQLELYRQSLSQSDPKKQLELMRQVVVRAVDEFYVIGICQELNRQAVLAADFRNVPEPLIDAWTYPDPAPANPCQFFISPNPGKEGP